LAPQLEVRAAATCDWKFTPQSNRLVSEGKPGYVLVIANWKALLKHAAEKR
jgi:hypothetical protein